MRELRSGFDEVWLAQYLLSIRHPARFGTSPD
jgi:hypothetical protein